MAKITPKKREKFLEVLAATGHVSLAAKSTGCTRNAFYGLRGRDEEFRAKWDDALEIASSILVEEAWRRAAKGTLKPVFHQGSQCGQIREYSDTLLIFLLKGLDPDRFKDRAETKHLHEGKVEIVVTRKVVNGQAT